MEVTLHAARDELIMLTTHCPSRPYIELQIPANVARVKRLTVRLTGQDQGFCDDEALKGQPGYTWYELGVERPSGRSNVPRECIFQNPAGVLQWHTPVIDSNDGKSKTLQSLIDELRPLDIVQLCPRANFAGWVNFLLKAEIDIQCTTLSARPGTAPLLRPRYSNLDSDGDAIRLLELMPSHDAGEVCVKLTSARLGFDCAPYEALSYCWGQSFHSHREHSSNDVMTIQCSDDDMQSYQVHVSSSLWGALLHLRDPVRPRVLWVDQLCINQADKDELSRQVSMMGRIYSGSESVVIWLGGGDVEIERSIDTVNELLPRFHEPSKGELKDGSFKCELPGISIESLPHKEVTQILTLPWFWRVWVVQEVWLARRRNFMYGRRTLSWSTIRKANLWSKWGSFEIPGAPHTNLPLIWTSFAEKDLAEHDKDFVRAQLWPPLHSNLLTLVIQGLDLKASDPRDHIFGLLGIFEQALSNEDGSNRLVYPDYNKSVSQVFTDFTIWEILRTKSLRILSSIQAMRGRTWQSLGCTASSRVPPHDMPPPEHPSWAMWYSGMRKWENESLAGSYRHRVTGGSEPNISLIAWDDPHRKFLILQGYRIGRIQSIGPYRFPFDRVDSDIFKAYNRVFDASGTRRLYSTPVTEAFEGYKEGWDDPSRHWRAHGELRGNILLLPPALPCLDDCVFELDDGSKGLCPTNTKPGDIVVILYGGDVPYLLREAQAKGQCVFIGECYLDGKMDKNLLTPLEEAGIPREDFVLV